MPYRRFDRRVCARLSPFCSRHITFFPPAIALAAAAWEVYASEGVDIKVAWDPVEDPRVAFYEVYWGTQSRQYQSSRQTTSTNMTIEQLAAGETYFFAAKACDEAKLFCSAFSEEISTTIDYTAPIADFTASTTSGVAPLTVTFDHSSNGQVEDYAWDFGDGNTSTAGTAVHRYDDAGTYTVSLTVTGPGGTSVKTQSGLISVANPISDASTNDKASSSNDSSSGTETLTERQRLWLERWWKIRESNWSTEAPTAAADLKLEAADVAVGPEWQRVEFEHAFTDPVVVATSVSGNGAEPTTVRIQGVDPTGFWVRLQDWGYSNGLYTTEPGPEVLGYLVVERGSHQLPNGAWLEADEFPIFQGEAWHPGRFLAPFATIPVVLTTVVTYNDTSAVTPRLRRVNTTDFELMLQGAESNGVPHGREMVAYVASEGFCSELNGRRVVVGKTADEVTHTPTELWFSDQCADLTNGFTTPPTLLADMQTTDGPNTANLRWDNKGTHSARVWVDEEQSMDAETSHTTEVVGYLAIGEDADSTPVYSAQAQ
ncbi:MAG: PKD domain-containing protein [Gammaproteobacteria bacterium]|jgi:PKD repeat protein|nr:PKD domain-containing protein [Gammaproteobacteria bacterium]